MNISKLKGIGEQTAMKFARLGISDTDDLLYFYPRGYEAFEPPVVISGIFNDGIYSVYGMLLDVPKMNYHSHSRAISVTVRDEVGETMKVTWFHSAYLIGKLKKGDRYVFRGRVHRKGKLLCMDMPRLYDPAEYTNLLRYEALKPLYPLTEGLKQNSIRKAVQQCFETVELPKEFLPDDFKSEQELMDFEKALYAIHFPRNEEECHKARNRLVFDEFFLFSLGIRLQKEVAWACNDHKASQSPYSQTVLSNLPYELTKAQNKVYHEILEDFAGPHAANRLIQGDVGSGKTILAFLSMLDMVYAGDQCVMMAPTEVLATQHYDKLQSVLSENKLPVQARLLTGSTPEKQKNEIRREAEEGTAQIIIGTHAVFTDKMKYARLGLVITDEQHRFGVNQREALANKGLNPHIFVMSATPIPRSLAVILYGDLDISLVDEKPSNRLEIKNCVVDSSYHPNAYRFIANELKKGHQAYIVCAMAVGSDDEDEPDNVVDYSEELKKEFEPGTRIAYLHGQMNPGEKQRIMERFLSHDIDILVSTTVIEVGVDVPNATVMMIENAERFGLATLHQLRGRVGRGRDQSYCILVSDSQSEQTKTRLGIIKESNDGFYIAESDLKLRGPGDILGTRQSGDFGFDLGNIYADSSVLTKAAKAAEEFLKRDPQLDLAEHEAIRLRLQKYMERRSLRLNI